MYKSYTVEYQICCNGEGQVLTSRFTWEGDPINNAGNASIVHARRSVHKNVTPSSYARLAFLMRDLVESDYGRITPWFNSPGSWSYMPNLKHFREVENETN